MLSLFTKPSLTIPSVTKPYLTDLLYNRYEQKAMRPLQIMKKKHPWHGLYPIKVRITIPNHPYHPNRRIFQQPLSRCRIRTLSTLM